MEYTTEQALEEIVRRRKQVRKRRNRKRCIAFASLSCFLMAALTVVINVIPAGSDAYSLGTTYGSFLLSPQAGGYVFTAVLAFGAGVSIAVYALRRRGRYGPETEQNENDVKGIDAKGNDAKGNDEKGNDINEKIVKDYDKKEGET